MKIQIHNGPNSIQCEATDSEWEDIDHEQELYPTLEIDREDWADRFTNSIRTYHGVDS